MWIYDLRLIFEVKLDKIILILCYPSKETNKFYTLRSIVSCKSDTNSITFGTKNQYTIFGVLVHNRALVCRWSVGPEQCLGGVAHIDEQLQKTKYNYNNKTRFCLKRSCTIICLWFCVFMDQSFRQVNSLIYDYTYCSALKQKQILVRSLGYSPPNHI